MNKKTNIFDKFDDWIRIDFKFQDYIKLITSRKLRNWRKLDFLGNRAKWKHIYTCVYVRVPLAQLRFLWNNVFLSILLSLINCVIKSPVSTRRRNFSFREI